MKIWTNDRNVISSLFLVITAAAILIFAYTTNRNDLTTGLVIISAIILFLTGVFQYSMAKINLVDSQISSLHHVQGTINLCKIATDMGINGHAIFIPKIIHEKSGVKQFIPVSEYKKGELYGDSFVSGSAGTGILISPQGEPLMDYLKTHSHLQLPHAEKEIFTLIQETLVDTLELAEKIDILKSEDGFLIAMNEYQLITGCVAIREESPVCCQMNPCPVCSLLGMILAEGLNHTIKVERCYPNKKKNSVEIHFSK